MSSAFNAIQVCNTHCIKNLASIAISVNGPLNIWKTSEVEHMGIIISGIKLINTLLVIIIEKSLKNLNIVNSKF